MSASNVHNAIAQVKQCDAQAILKAASSCDGHSIFDPQLFRAAGLPEAVVAHLTRTYRSDGSPKGTLFIKGQAVAESRGVYGLDLLQFLAHALQVSYPSRFGRGSQARAIQEALRQHFQSRCG